MVDMGGAGVCVCGGVGGIMAPPSSIFEVLSGQATLSLGLSLSSVRLCVCVDIVSRGQGSGGRERGCNFGFSQEK